MNKYDMILKKAEQETLNLNHPYVGTEHLLLAILKTRTKLSEYLKNQNLTYKKFKTQLVKLIGQSNNKNEYTLYTPMLRCVLNSAEEYATINNVEIDEVVLFNSIIDAKEGIAIRVLETMNVNIEKLKYRAKINFKYGIILNDKVLDENIVGREVELSNIIQTLLRKNKCNPLLIGKAGVGKTALIEELARRINKKQVPKELENCQILKLDFANLVAGTKYRGEFEEKITNLINEVKENKNIILFVDEIHTLVNAGASDGAIGAGDIFKPFLARGELKLIGATTIKEYHKFIEPDKALSRRLAPVMLEEPDFYSTQNILFNVKKTYEDYHKVHINEDNINLIINLTIKYLPNKSNPDKSIELLDSLCSYVKYQGKNKILINDIYSFFNERYHISLLGKKENEIIKYINTKKCLVTNDFDSIKNNLKNIYNCNLFLNIDLNNYNTPFSINNFLGNPNYPDKEYLIQRFIDNPFGVLFIKNYNKDSYLKDSIDKIIKNHVLIDNLGNEVNFSNVLIIVDNTTNNTNPIGFVKNNVDNNLSEYFIKWNEPQISYN